ncbi:hypothetical protein LCGC14_3156570 [marine sediment metagenome]|uniref:Uncharacterized protein n=1 Tax=marine sediment metagenome TaxID=412755 RepID=A0A0F8VSF5_9ZZZZ
MPGSTGTHFANWAGKRRTRLWSEGRPIDPQQGDEYYDSTQDTYYRYNGTIWVGAHFTTTTSTSTSTTTTSTSTTTTSTSSSTSTTTSTSTSTSTTTTV